MPTGGTTAKLGNRYEGVWTVARLLELAVGKSESLEVEPIEESLGIEFVVRCLDGSREFHSAKRQHAKGEWSVAELTRPDKRTGRKILGDLFEKLSVDATAKCCFVSSTGANHLLELTERALRLQSMADFREDLNSSIPLRQACERLLPLASGSWDEAYDFLRRLRVVLIDESTLTNHVEHHIAYLVYRPDMRAVSEAEVRLLLGEYIQGCLGTPIRQEAVWDFLSQRGYARRDWASDPAICDLVRNRNREYMRTVEGDLINNVRIPRAEAQSIIQAVTQGARNKKVIVSAAAGCGKSCVLTQVVTGLESQGVPFLVIRMDRHGDAHSTQEVGSHMGLPQSPAVVLAGLANGRDSVLVVDQLDAVSQVSGRYPHLWDVFDSLCQEVDAYPNMRLVIACRDFDLQHDQRLRKLREPETAKEVAVGLLSLADVDTAIAAAARDPLKLDRRQKEILQIPLHLLLFLDGLGDERDEISFRGIGALFERYWDRKRRDVSARLGGASRWADVIDRLCETMSAQLTVYAPHLVLDDWDQTVAGMLTEHVLVQDGSQIRFFHESFFDYAFARRFVAGDQDLMTLLFSSEQHLFRRGQVRQVLAFLREHARDRYREELRGLLTDSRTRFHIKRLILAWLGTLADPDPEEWGIIETLLSNPEIHRHALPPIRNSLPWFDLLNRLGVIGRWLESADGDTVNLGMWFLSFEQLQKLRSEAAAALLDRYRGEGSEWVQRLRGYFRLGGAHWSHPMQELFLRLFDTGTFGEEGRDKWWHCLHDAVEHAPRFAIEVLAHWLDQKMARVTDKQPRLAFSRQDDRGAIALVTKAAKKEPEAYVDEIFPRVLAILRLCAMPSHGGLQKDSVWCHRSNREPLYLIDAVLDALVAALEKLARENADKIEHVTHRLLEIDSATLTYLLIRTWSANPERFGDTCVRFLSADSRRLLVGYASPIGGGEGIAAVSREAIQACLPFVAVAEREQLEQVVCGIAPPGGESECEGWMERLLLEAFGEEQLSAPGRGRLRALRDKFPQQNIAIPPRRCPDIGPFVGPPIPPDETKQFTDEQWLDAMRTYDYGWDWSPGAAAVLHRERKGSAVELSRQLKTQVRGERRRFAALAAQMEDTIRPEYFEAILDGLCGLENLSKEDREADNADFHSLESDVVLGVVRRLHRLPRRPCGRSICLAFERLADGRIPDEDLNILAYYALEDADPACDSWLEQDSAGTGDASEAAHCDGYNSVRGHAARAIGALLWAHYSRSRVLLPLIRQMVRDHSLAVRTCVVEALFPVLNHDRDKAVRLFLEACDGAALVFGSGPFEHFVGYASRTHYSKLRTLLQETLQSASEAAVSFAARQICLAGLGDDAAEADAEAVRTGSETMRRAAAEVYSNNLDDTTVGSICRKQLCQLFADKSEQVRAVAAGCFANLKDVDFKEYTDLIRTYIESPAFPSQHDGLLRRLQESTWQLPDVTIRLAKRFIEARGTEASDLSTAAAGDAVSVSKLVVRLYAQSKDVVVQRECLDLIDAMERLAFLGIDSELAMHDR